MENSGNEVWLILGDEFSKAEAVIEQNNASSFHSVLTDLCVCVCD